MAKHTKQTPLARAMNAPQVLEAQVAYAMALDAYDDAPSAVGRETLEAARATFRAVRDAEAARIAEADAAAAKAKGGK